MSSFLISFFISAFLTLLVIRHSKLHGWFLDSDLSGVQKVHVKAVPRIGGLSIFAAVLLCGIFTMVRAPSIGKWIALLLLCSTVA
ncbi:MAG: glycosyl transferase, partial [Herminiimonas sp.]|nr:glycosyl transferase [Herminiimonas sp.]